MEGCVLSILQAPVYFERAPRELHETWIGLLVV